MQAYAPVERLAVGEQFLPFEPTSATALRRSPTNSDPDNSVIDQLLGRLADLVVDRLMECAATNANESADLWMDARGAAEYLGIHRDTLRKLAAERSVPVHQDGPRCKLYFRRDELDDWRRSSRTARSRLRAVS